MSGNEVAAEEKGGSVYIYVQLASDVCALCGYDWSTSTIYLPSLMGITNTKSKS